jgi:FkbM family methyltransferase
MWSRLLRGKKKRGNAPSRLSNQEVRTLVTALYRGFLGRDPEPDGLQSWMQQIERGAFDTSLLEKFLRSPEHAAKVAAEADTDGLCRGLASFLTSHGFRGPLTIVDVGAQMQKTKDHAYARLLDLVPCRIVGFEPLDERRREREQAEGDGNLSMRPDFIGDGRRHVFHINEPDVTSSLLPLNEAVTGHLMEWNRIRTVRQVNADTVTLDTAIGEGERVDLLQLDIQGFEHAALAGAPAVLARTLAVHCEVEFLELYRGQPLFAEIDLLLRKAGFRFLDFHNPARHAFDIDAARQSADQLGWADAIYFKDRDLVSDPTDLLVQALIATAVYKKTSFARWLADAYDARTGQSTAGLFH